jgi:hypothetical protein
MVDFPLLLFIAKRIKHPYRISTQCGSRFWDVNSGSKNLCHTYGRYTNIHLKHVKFHTKRV